ncbi:MAG: hypothetical protein QOG56_704 [Solirubrobacteraceae bacterium]|nr:hypothetical protein [Solirubrobacteraceae bacterium]
MFSLTQDKEPNQLGGLARCDEELYDRMDLHVWASRRCGRGLLGVLVGSTVLVCGACGDGSSSSDAGARAGSASRPSADEPGALQGPRGRPAPAAVRASVLPRELVATWISTDEGAAELIYVFNDDGTYKHAGVLLQERDTGLFSYKIGARGSARTRGHTLVLRQHSGTQSLRDPDSPSSNFDKAMRPTVKRYTWATRGGLLFLTDSTEAQPIEYRRQ